MTLWNDSSDGGQSPAGRRGIRYWMDRALDYCQANDMSCDRWEDLHEQIKSAMRREMGYVIPVSLLVGEDPTTSQDKRSEELLRKVGRDAQSTFTNPDGKAVYGRRYQYLPGLGIVNVPKLLSSVDGVDLEIVQRALIAGSDQKRQLSEKICQTYFTEAEILLQLAEHSLADEEGIEEADDDAE